MHTAWLQLDCKNHGAVFCSHHWLANFLAFWQSGRGLGHQAYEVSLDDVTSAEHPRTHTYTHTHAIACVSTTLAQNMFMSTMMYVRARMHTHTHMPGHVYLPYWPIFHT